MKKWLSLLLLFIVGACSPSKPTLHVFCWTEYISNSLVEEFEKQYQCRVVLDSFDSNEVMFAKLRGGFYGYDLICPSNYYVDLLKNLGAGLEKIDQKKMPNIENLDKELLGPIDPSILEYGVPFLVSYTGIGFRHDRIPNLPHSWDVFGNPLWKGRMTMLNDMRETIGAALSYLGFSINSTDPEEIAKATSLLLEWRSNLAKFENEQYQNGLATAEYLIVQGYGGDILQVAVENPEVEFFIPRKGGTLSTDLWVIPSTASEKDLAYAFINFLYEPDISAAIIEHVLMPCPNKAAYPLLPKRLQEHPGLFPEQETRQELEYIHDLGEEIVLYNKSWDVIKSY